MHGKGSSSLVCVLALAISWGCDPGSSSLDAGIPDDGGDGGFAVDAGAPMDASSGDAGAGDAGAGDAGAEDAGAEDAGAGDAGGGDDAGPGADGGAAACGSEPVPPGRRFPASCSEPRCHGDASCAIAVIAGFGLTGYTACGRTYTFDALASQSACMNEPFGGFHYPAMCGRIDFQGTVELYCAPDRSRVVAYFWGRASEALSSVASFLYLSHEYSSGPRAGSGRYSEGELSSDFREVLFHGFEDVEVTPSPPGFTPQTLSVWFHTQDIAMPTAGSTSGGFEILLEP